MYLLGWDRHDVQPFRSKNGLTLYYKWIDNFRTFGKVSLYPQLAEMDWKPNTEKTIQVQMKNESGYPADFQSNPDCAPQITYSFFEGDKVVFSQKAAESLAFTLTDTATISLPFKTPPKAGKYYLIFSLSQCEDFTMNGYFRKVEVK